MPQGAGCFLLEAVVGGLFFGKPGEAEVAASEVFGNSLMCKNLTWIFQRL